MDITSVHKYIALNKMANGTVEVMFAGQPCLTIHEHSIGGSVWKINPVFAKLVYGANIFEDIPQCIEASESTETAIAAGLVKLHELGAFTTEVDFPEDTYAATLNTIAEDVKVYSLKNSKTLMEALQITEKIMKSIKNNTFQMNESGRSEYAANVGLSSKSEPKTGKHSLKTPSGSTISTHDSENEAVAAYKNLSDSKGVKIVRESEIDITADLMLEDSKEEKAEEKQIVSALKKDKKFTAKADKINGE